MKSTKILVLTIVAMLMATLTLPLSLPAQTHYKLIDLGTSAQFTFSSLDYPGATLETRGRGINNHGEIVGRYFIASPGHAYLFKAGQFAPLAPSTVLGTNDSEAWKINDRGDVVGHYSDDIGGHGFLLRKGVLTTLDFPTANNTLAIGINESGTVVGFWVIADNNGNLVAIHGFTWNNGTFTQVDFPGAGATFLYGINARGDIVGEWDSDIFGTIVHGFVLTKGQFITVDVPFAGAAAYTQVNAINAQGSIVGTWIDAGGVTHGFLGEGAKFTNLDFPGAIGTTAWGINSAGQMVGNWFDNDFNAHGWLAQPVNKGKPH